MKRNRKKTETYRFNGLSRLHSRSIFSVTIADLESQIVAVEAKLADPDDADDKKWVGRWLLRLRAELDKKRRGLEFKADEKAKGRTREPRLPSEPLDV